MYSSYVRLIGLFQLKNIKAVLKLEWKSEVHWLQSVGFSGIFCVRKKRLKRVKVIACVEHKPRHMYLCMTLTSLGDMEDILLPPGALLCGRSQALISDDKGLLAVFSAHFARKTVWSVISSW